MFAAALIAATLIHASGPSPAAQLAAAEHAAAFRVLLLPSSTQIVHAEASKDGTAVRLDYSIEGALIRIEERVVVPGSQTSPDPQGELFNLDGYPALYHERSGYHAVSELTWYRPDVIVTLSSHDNVSAPLLVDVALELR
jgi:hypothetical protein